MKAYICCLMLSIAIIVGSWLNSDQQSSHKCEWDESRIEMNEAAISNLITTSEDQARTIEALSSTVIDWNMLFTTLYK